MKTVLYKSVRLSSDDSELLINVQKIRLDELTVRYKESTFYSYLEITSPEGNYLIKGLKSIWEMFSISTYDVLEKREDNKIFNLYRMIRDLSEK